jgi:hypothetical protein
MAGGWQPASGFSIRDCRCRRSHLYKERKGRPASTRIVDVERIGQPPRAVIPELDTKARCLTLPPPTLVAKCATRMGHPQRWLCPGKPARRWASPRPPFALWTWKGSASRPRAVIPELDTKARCLTLPPPTLVAKCATRMGHPQRWLCPGKTSSKVGQPPASIRIVDVERIGQPPPGCHS